MEDCRLWLVEAALAHADLIGHARPAARIEPRLGGAELASTLEECMGGSKSAGWTCCNPTWPVPAGSPECAESPSSPQCAAPRAPHCWMTGINAAAARHLLATSPNVPLVEMLTPELFDSPLRRELVSGER